MSITSVLVVDDEPAIRQLIEEILRDEGYAVSTAASLAAARALLAQATPDLMLLDVWLPDGDGVEFLRELAEGGGLPAPTVMISGHGNIETAVNAVRVGAYDFLEKPVSLAKLLLTVQRALEASRLSRENAGLRRQLLPSAPVGTSPATRMLTQQLQRAAQTDAALMIRGEPGTGKETLARYVHQMSTRAHAAFVRLAPGVVAAERLSAALFGREDATGVAAGALEQAAGGTLYLDEIAGLPDTIQARLAAALESRRFARDHGRADLPVQARLIAASAQPLEVELGAGRLREDLFYQLNVLSVQAQSLRERRGDIADLLDAQIALIATRDALPQRTMSADALARLVAHDWPGNLRELRNLIQRLLIMGDEGEIDLDEVTEALGIVAPGPGRIAGDFLLDLSVPLRDARERFERAYLMRQLKLCAGSVSRLAAVAGMERTHLYRKLKDLGVDPKSLDVA
ncbi:MAG: sigma-54-dependent transcriptional regulator [Lysobacterales bacterium]